MQRPDLVCASPPGLEKTAFLLSDFIVMDSDWTLFLQHVHNLRRGVAKGVQGARLAPSSLTSQAGAGQTCVRAVHFVMFQLQVVVRLQKCGH